MKEPIEMALHIFYIAASCALMRAETRGRMPERFCGVGQKRWDQFANELTEADLIDLVVRDASRVYPIPFAIRSQLPGFDDKSAGISSEEANKILNEYGDVTENSLEEYLIWQANVLGIDIMNATDSLPEVEAHHKILECPGTGGWLSYQMAIKPESKVYFWENFCIACANWQEMMFAGLIAFELDSPPSIQLPIVLDETLSSVLVDRHYDWIVGSRKMNAHQALSSFTNRDDRVVLI